ncbi:GNAT family N-acetyltransferase [Thalassorhabdomicrobium marinisediminis]|uniref:GNAT family N-acetyltransferase n=1 Tax=Thalassorhabdomicrobium marinisediminis TaxID=2170577 RepID=A0A2T7G115_9RHOB|nr:GNAT family N-acetyltransferase [Thalassorhabdomicrobium marinisediminis]PVA08078.1 GNAT family N-acetyltransferase [Thalassorhabdomicrobium marinisediminis]
MTTAIHLAGPEDAPRLLALVTACHEETGIARSEDHRAAALAPLLEGSPLGAAWLFGLAKAPTGYIIITFGWSVEHGGMDATVEELFIRPSVRKRGIASEVLSAISASLRGAGITALHVKLDPADEATQRLFARAHFKPHARAAVMTRSL